jgi:hypothetical protein
MKSMATLDKLLPHCCCCESIRYRDPYLAAMMIIEGRVLIAMARWFILDMLSDIALLLFVRVSNMMIMENLTHIPV